MTDERRKLLTLAMGEAWHTIEDSWGEPYGPKNRTFSTPDDWELVRVNVIVPNQEAFCEHLDKHGVWMIIWFSLSLEDRNKIAADFIKAHPNRFPWVVEVEDKK